MSSSDIRLRLVIRRHAVPEVKLVWPCAATEDFTISRLLIDVNEVVPLESEDWGLEDYAVELSDAQGASFECLHFQKVGKVLKEGDQVIIRALLSEDIRRRRLSGRHQISADGSHLVDGITFGRAWRPPRDRPALRLPPRKRLRATHDDGEDDDEDDDEDAEEYEPRQLLLSGPARTNAQDATSVAVRAMFNNANHGKHVSFNGEDDFEAPDAESMSENDDEEDDRIEDEEMEELQEELQEELRLLKSDNAILGEDETLDTVGDGLLQADTPMPSASINLPWLDNVAALRFAFPFTPQAALDAELKRCGQDIRHAYNALAKLNDPILSFDEMLERAMLGPLEPTEPSEPESPATLFPSKPTRPLIEEVESFDNPASEAPEDGTSPSVVAAAATLSADAVYESDDDTSSSVSWSSSDSKDSDESDSESKEDSDGRQNSATDVPTASVSVGLNAETETSEEDSSDEDTSSDDTSSDDSSSDDDSSSSEDETDNSDARSAAESLQDVASDSDSSSDDSDSSSDDSESGSEPEVARTTATAHDANTHTSIAQDQTKQANDTPSSQGPSQPPYTGLSRTQKRNARRRELKRRKLEDVTTPGLNSQDEERDQELLARKEKLLSSFNETETTPVTTRKGDKAAHGTQNQGVDAETPQTESPATDSSARRSRIDLGAGRRLLFGALGLKNPKTKADEDNLRKGLLKDVRPLKNARIEVVEEVKDDDATEENPDWWREKIIYRAVECCHEGLVLSEPPFPFVQRWDPQQKYNSMRKRKRTSQNFQDDSYYDESSWYDQEADAGNDRQSKKQKSKKSKLGQTNAEEFDDTMELNYDDEPVKPSDASPADEDDLPPLPADVASLPAMQADQVRPGMVITWKQLLMSKATNWQPQIVPVTGLVLPDSTPENLHIVLAKRDREQSERQFDETGQRIYGKFEVPDLDDEEVEDDGHRNIAWAEMIEPRLLQQEPVSISDPPDESRTMNGHVNGSGLNGKPTAIKVSDSQIPANPSPTSPGAQDVSPIDTGSAVEEITAKTDNDASFPVGSGQRMPSLELPLSGDVIHLSTSSDSWEAPKIQAASDVANSPTRQLQELSAASIRNETPTPMIYEDDQVEQRTAADVPAEVTMTERVASEEVEPLIGNFEGGIAADSTSRDVGSVPAERKEQFREDLTGHDSGTHESQDSIHSGRQIQPDCALEEASGTVEELVIPETVLEAHETGSPVSMPQTQASSSSSPLPSLQEIFYSASTSRQVASPLKSGARSQPTKVFSDPAYEEAMRRLDDGDESDGSTSKSQTMRNLFPNATQPDPITKVDRKEEPSTSIRSERLRRRSTPFKAPDESEVISIESSPISAQFKEVYAEDSMDETYKPKGSGSATKHGDGASTKAGVKGRKKLASAPATRVLKSKQPIGSTKGSKLRRKTGDKF